MRRLFSIVFISLILLAALPASAESPQGGASAVSAPTRAPDSYTNGVNAFNQGDYQRAITYFAGLGSTSPDYGMISNYYIGASLVALGAVDQAKPFFQKNLERLSKNNREYSYMRSLSQLALARIAYSQLEDMPALAYYKKVLEEPEVNDSHKHALLEMASLYNDKGNHIKALDQLNVLIPQIKNRRDSLLGGALLVRGQVLMKLGRFEGAQRDFETLISDFQRTDKGLDDFKLAGEAGLARLSWEKKGAASRELKNLNRERSASAKHLTTIFSEMRTDQGDRLATPDSSTSGPDAQSTENKSKKEGESKPKGTASVTHVRQGSV